MQLDIFDICRIRTQIRTLHRSGQRCIHICIHNHPFCLFVAVLLFRSTFHTFIYEFNKKKVTNRNRKKIWHMSFWIELYYIWIHYKMLQWNVSRKLYMTACNIQHFAYSHFAFNIQHRYCAFSNHPEHGLFLFRSFFLDIDDSRLSVSVSLEP